MQWGTVGEWAAAAGTIIAVWFALSIARWDRARDKHAEVLRDLDETRRLLYMALTAVDIANRNGMTSVKGHFTPEFFATVLNALRHHGASAVISDTDAAHLIENLSSAETTLDEIHDQLQGMVDVITAHHGEVAAKPPSFWHVFFPRLRPGGR